MSFESHLQTSITIKAPTKKTSQMKSTTRVWTETECKGNIENLSGNELVTMGRLGKSATHRLYIKSSVTIDTGYCVEAGGVQYEVEGVVSAAGITNNHHTEAFLIYRG